MLQVSFLRFSWVQSGPPSDAIHFISFFTNSLLLSFSPLPCSVDSDEYEVIDYVSKMALNLCNARNDLSESSWLSACKPYLCVLMDEVTAENCVADYLKKMSKVRRERGITRRPCLFFPC